MAKLGTVISLVDLTRDAALVLRQVKESRKPAVITQEGRPEAVLFSFEAYQQVEAERELLIRLAEGEREIALGEGHDLRDVLNDADDLLLHPPD